MTRNSPAGQCQVALPYGKVVQGSLPLWRINILGIIPGGSMLVGHLRNLNRKWKDVDQAGLPSGEPFHSSMFSDFSPFHL